MGFFCKGIAGLVTTGILMTASIGMAAQAQAQAQAQADKDYVQSVFETMAGVKTAKMNVTMEIDTSAGNGKIEMKSEGTLQPEMVTKNDMTTTFTNFLGKEISTTMQCYLEQTKSSMVTYMMQDKKWVKSTTPFVNPNAGKTAAEQGKAAMENIKDIKTTAEGPDYKLITVTIDGRKISDQVDKIVKFPAKQKDEEKAFKAGVKAFGDCSYTMRVDKATKYVSDFSFVDFSKNVQNAVAAGVDASAMQPKQKESVKKFMKDVRIKIDIKMSDFDKVLPVEIPQDVRDAKEIEIKKKAPKADLAVTVPAETLIETPVEVAA
ncbi:MAG: hypothetical protein WCS30_00585 [Selenomonadaceae bacterium]